MSSSLIVPKINNNNHPEIVAIIKKAEKEIENIKKEMEKDVEIKNKEINDKAEIKELEDVIREKAERLATLKKNVSPPPMSKTFADIMKEQNGDDKVMDNIVKTTNNKPKNVKSNTKPKNVNPNEYMKENNPASSKYINQLCRGHKENTKCTRCHSVSELIEQATDMDTILFMLIGLSKNNNIIKSYSGDQNKSHEEFFNIYNEFIGFAKYKVKEYGYEETDLEDAINNIVSGNRYDYKVGREQVRKIMGYEMVSVSN